MATPAVLHVSPRLPAVWLLLVLPFAVAALGDVPRIVRLGSVTALGVLSVAQLFLAVTALFAVRAMPRSIVAPLVCYALFLGWMILRSVVTPTGQEGIQTGVTLALLGAQFLLCGTLASFSPVAALFVLRKAFLAVDLIALPLVLVSFLQSGLGSEQWVVAPRAVALFANVPICWHLAGWCYGRRRAGLRGLAWILAVVLSMSRTAMVVAAAVAVLAFLAGGWVRPTRLASRAPAFLLGTLVLFATIFIYQSDFYERFFTGFNAVEVGGVNIDSSGRNNIWPVVVASAMHHPIVGGGLGSSQAALAELSSDTVSHPHNEYLRIWHDGGLIGVSLFVFSVVSWLTLLAARWLSCARRLQLHPEVQLAAALTLVGLTLAATTDNGLVYANVVSPSGALIGAAFGVWSGARGRPARVAEARD